MRKALACGIDFGTTNSSVSIAYDNGDVELVDIDSSANMPHSLLSIVYIDRDGFQQAGQDAVKQFMITGSNSTACADCDLVEWTPLGPSTDCKQFQVGGGCQDARLISGLKSLLAPTENGTTHSWARDFDLKDFVAIIIKELKNRVDSRAGDSINKVILGHPVVFSGAEDPKHPNHNFLQKQAKTRLKEAAQIAGFSDIKLFSEPDAVLLDQPSDDGYVLAADFGGGTYDAAVLENKGGKAKTVGRQGVAVGGEIFDGLLFDNRAADAIGMNQKSKSKNLSLPNWIVNNMRTLAGIPHLLQCKKLHPTLTFFKSAGIKIDAIREILFGGQAYNFYSAIERAKIELSKNQVAQIFFGLRSVDVSPPISRDDFDRWISPFLDKVDKATLAALNKAGITPQDVHTVLQTGGSSQIPQFIDRLESIFPNAEIRERPAFTSVAYGLGIYALKVWGNSDDRQQPSKEVSIPMPKELDEFDGSEQSQEDAPQEHKDVHSWLRRFWMRLRRGVWRKKKVLKAPRPDAEPVVRDIPPDRQPVSVPEEIPKKKLTLEEQACAAARAHAQEHGHEIGEFVPKANSSDSVSSAICKKCGLNIDAVVGYDFKEGLPKVGGKAKGQTCKGVGGYSSGTS